MTRLSFTLFVAATYFLLPHGFKRNVKDAYRPYGPKMCEELCKDPGDSFIYDVADLSCRRLSVKGTKKLERYITDEQNVTLRRNDMSAQDSKALTHALTSSRHFIPSPEETPIPEQVVETTKSDTSLAPTPSRHLVPFSATNPTLFQVVKRRIKSDELRTHMESTTEVIRADDPDVVQYNYNITLHRACYEGKLGAVRYILSNQLEDIDSRDKRGRTPVMIAAVNENKAVFEFLLSQGCDLSVVDNDKTTVLHLACQGGNIDIVKNLINDQNFDKDIRGWHGWTPVMFAFYSQHKGVVDFLVSKGCNLTAVNSEKQNLLHVASFGGYVEGVNYIITQDIVSIDSTDCYGKTPIITALCAGHCRVADLLIRKGCKVRALDNMKNNILHIASVIGNADMMKCIFKLKIVRDIDSRNANGRTALLVAAVKGHLKVTELLIEKGCNVKAVDNQKNNILHTACIGGNVQMVRYVIGRHIVGLDSRGILGRTAVMLAAHKGHSEVIRLLINEGCNLKAVDRSKKTVLHLACLGGHIDMVKYITSTQLFKINARDDYRRTPVMLAAVMGHAEVVAFLRNSGCHMKLLDQGGNNILHVACNGGHVNMVRYIIRLGIVSRTEKNANGMTPAQVAQTQGHGEIVALLEAGK